MAPTHRPSHRLVATGIACAAGLGLALGGCGGSSGGGGTGTTGPAAPGGHLAQANGLKLSQCMRTHGVPNFPDPTSGGAIRLTPGLDPSSPSFQAAQKACSAYAPTKGAPAHMTATQLRKAMAFAVCMRKHGQPDFPDPLRGAPSQTGQTLALQGLLFAVPSGINPMSSQFRRSVRECGIPLPAPPPGQ